MSVWTPGAGRWHLDFEELKTSVALLRVDNYSKYVLCCRHVSTAYRPGYL